MVFLSKGFLEAGSDSGKKVKTWSCCRTLLCSSWKMAIRLPSLPATLINWSWRMGQRERKRLRERERERPRMEDPGLQVWVPRPCQQARPVALHHSAALQGGKSRLEAPDTGKGQEFPGGTGLTQGPL